MQFEVEHAPTFSVLTVSLDEGETVYAQPHAMVSMTPRVEIRAKLGAQQATRGWIGGLKNLLTGESLFAAIFMAKAAEQQVVLAPETIGEVFSLPLGEGRGYYLTRGAYLASSPEVLLAVKYGGVRGFLAAKGWFLMHATGEGTVFCSSHGAIVRRELAEGERFVVDNKYVVAFSDTVEYQLVKATDSLRDSVFSGEGLVNRYTGPGTVYYQTRSRPSMGGLLAWIFQAAT
ncbi:hypothetical protein Pla108_13590 [Botrimarina colliarenosi]|uniref:TIGR00266 family protein n=1 Tax=Botrimarina colliarenosi TaxID=2528001 RepID=A0A5C6ALQ7_9BACT|nr:TIGR00266 family protein [Botrimarina colliarenosi]TWU00408.1 hypothetical protein Pla108_13590 [Botrimarina colliarenosi]